MNLEKYTWIEDLSTLDLSGDVCQFLRALPGPSMIYIPGKTDKLRVLSTLMHGDESSGIKATFKLLKEGFKAQTNLLLIISSIDAALYAEPFSHRMVPGQPDINRCFNPPYESEVALLAKEMLDVLKKIDFECLLDLHNTSGSGPAFAISHTDNHKTRALTCLFANTLIHAELNLGSLLECRISNHPIVGVECGGKADGMADEVAYAGLKTYFTAPEIFDADTDHCNVLQNPLRLELEGQATISYSDNQLETDVTMPANADQYNLQIIMPGQKLARLKQNDLSALKVRGSSIDENVDTHFEVQESYLVPKHPLRLFMTTTDPKVAMTDCMFYFVTV